MSNSTPGGIVVAFGLKRIICPAFTSTDSPTRLLRKRRSVPSSTITFTNPPPFFARRALRCNSAVSGAEYFRLGC